MTPIQVAQLMDAVAQLVLLVQDLKAGVVTDAQAWDTSKAKFDQAVITWDTVTAGKMQTQVQGVLPLSVTDNQGYVKPDLTVTGQPVSYIPKAL